MINKSTIAIFNGTKSSPEIDQMKQEMKNRFFEIRETEHESEAFEIGRYSDVDQIIVAGGDGTVNGVVGGVVNSKHSPVIGILPLGTGNDLTRSLGINAELQNALEAIDTGRVQELDVGFLNADGFESTFINVSSCGFSGEVDKILENTDKAFWKKASYLKSAFEALSNVTPFKVQVLFDEQSISLMALNVVVGNGRFAGCGIPVAPEALLDDRMLDIVVYLGEKITDQLVCAKQILTGEHFNSEGIICFRAHKFDLLFEPEVLFNYDGDLAKTPANKISYSVHPRKVRFLVAPDFKAT